MGPVPHAQGAPVGRQHHLKARVRTTLAITMGGHALCHASKVAVPLVGLSVAAADFDVGLQELGLVIAAFSVAMGLTSVPAGLAADRWGSVRVLTLFFWVLALGAVACALATSYLGFLGAHALLGVAAGIFHPAGLGLLSLSVPREDLGRAMGRFGVAGNVGIAITPLLMLTEAGWRAGFFGLAGLAVLGALATHVASRSRMLLQGVPEASDPKAPEQHGLGNGLFFLLAAISVNAFMLDGYIAIFPETLRDLGVFVVDARTLSVSILVLGGVGQYIGGLLARDFLSASRYAVIMFLQPLILLSVSHSLDEPAWPFMLLASFAFMNFMTQPIENQLLASFTSSRRRGVAYAMKFLVALIVAAPAPWIVARLYEGERDSGTVYLVLAMLGMLGVFAGYFFLRSTRRRARKAPAN